MRDAPPPAPTQTLGARGPGRIDGGGSPAETPAPGPAETHSARVDDRIDDGGPPAETPAPGPAETPGDRIGDSGPPAETPLPAPATVPGDRRGRLARLGDRIAELSARIQAATYELLVLIREFDEGQGWDGCLSCAQWLSWRAGLAPGAAREHVRVARALGKLPKLSDAMRRGRISYSKVRAVTRVATPDNEDNLLYVCQAGTAAHVERIARAWRRIDQNTEQAEDRLRNAGRELRTWVDEDGMVIVRGRLTPEVGAALRRALEAACDQARREAAPDGGGEMATIATADGEGEAADAPAGGPTAEAGAAGAPAGAAVDVADTAVDVEEPTFAQRQADAIGTVAEAALAGGLDRGTAGDRYQVVLHVDAEALAAPRDVSAGTSGSAAAGSEPPTNRGDAPAGTSGGTPHDLVPPGTSAGVGFGPKPPPVNGDRVPAGTSAGVATGPKPPADGDRVPAGTPAADGIGDGLGAVANGSAGGADPAARGCGGAAETTGGASPSRQGRRRRAGGPCPGSRPSPAASATAASEDPAAAARRRGSDPAPCARRAAAPAATPRDAPAAPAAGSQTVLDEAGGIHVSAETARRLACDAATVTMRHGPDGEILDVGRRTRTISPALRRALAARDRRCRFPGCGNRRVDAHHIRHWADGGRTALDNLVLLCRRHHRAVHEEGFRVTMDAAGDVRFAHPDGRPLVEAPPAPAWTGPALQPTDDALAAVGIEIGADTATPSWGGERLDLDWTMHVLWRPRRKPTAE